MRVNTPLRLLVPLLLLLLSACSSFGSKKALDTLPVDKMYAEAKSSLIAGNYDRAEKYYQRLIARFPFGPYSEQAQLDLTYAQYKDNKPDDAYSTINRFIKTYPTQKHIDYAYYMRGLINFNRTAGLLEQYLDRDQSRRDQGFSQQSFDDFSQLVQRYPDSRYSSDARQRMIYLRNDMAKHELNVALYYLDRQSYIGAADRAQYIIEHYQRTPQAADALAVMAKAYSKLGRKELADQTTRVLKLNYPDHPYLADPDGWPHRHSFWYRMVPFSGHG